MFASTLIAVTLAAAPAQMVQCVDVPQGRTAASLEARGEAWFINGEPIALGKRRYVKFGLPRGLSPADVEPLQGYMSATVYAEAGNPKREVIYVLADIRDCTFQPYRAK